MHTHHHHPQQLLFDKVAKLLGVCVCTCFLPLTMDPCAAPFCVVNAALLIASKYEEIYAPAVRDLVHVSARAYTREEILRMETQILSTLKFEITQPTSHSFLQRFLRVIDADATLTDLASFYCERALQEYGMLRHLPSTVAAASLSLALRATHRPAWVSVHTLTLLRCYIFVLHV